MTALRRYRMAHGYTVERFAGKVLISASHLKHLEQGFSKPSPHLARAIADIFGAKVSAVFPDGVAKSEHGGRRSGAGRPLGAIILPPLPPPPAPRPFALRCWKCGAVRVSDHERCYQCGAEFTAREEARA
jgi:transcriptional regulator with XRE-family HTH domain